MNAGEKVVIIIPRDRSKPVSIEALGFTGSACEVATALLEAALGGAVERTYKPEFDEVVIDHHQTIGEG